MGNLFAVVVFLGGGRGGEGVLWKGELPTLQASFSDTLSPNSVITG